MPEASLYAIDAAPEAAPSEPMSPPVSLAEQELIEFSYIVSHDLAASLRYIAEFSQLMVRDLGDEASEVQRSCAKHIQLSTDKCRLMMDQLLAYSRVQQRPLKLVRSNVTRLVELAVLQLSAETRAANADITIEPLGEHMIDGELMTLALKHALANAIKFARPGVPPRIDVRGSEDASEWRVRITDNGIGAPLERQEKLFRMFYQDHPENTYPGVGAGLAICRRILRRHGGDAHFLGAQGDGACFEIHMPHLDMPS